ncbi:DUF6364 family protein [Algoriphagus sp.]|uniref:DUF6364 family protein n=1 Tax=Algoriphagus sp. TaxID=1872435 RepID=UPI00391DB5D5
MKTRVSVSVNEKLAKNAEKYSKQEGKSLSLLFEDFLKSLIEGDEIEDFTPHSKELMDLIEKDPPVQDLGNDKIHIANYLKQKYD